MLSDPCRNRLYNWKFAQAAENLDYSTATDQEIAMINALAVFGDPGWFDGPIATVIPAALNSIDVYP